MAAAEGPFLLFLTGPPKVDDAQPGASMRYLSVSGVGFAHGMALWGGPESGDAIPDQVFGEEGRCGRLVLDLAQRKGRAVKVIGT